MEDWDLDKKSLKKILDLSHDEIFVIDGNGVVIYVNKAVERNFHMPVEDFIGKSSYELAAKGFWSPSVTPRILREKKRIDVIQETKIGVKLLVTATPVLGEDGEVSMIIMNSRDVTEYEKIKKHLDEVTVLARKYKSEAEELRKRGLRVGDFIACSEEMKNIFTIIKRVAAVDSNILLLGESGTGKSFLAKCIHKSSTRSEKPFIILNCASIPEQLFESELFGYSPGAFTGANRAGKLGLIELADTGTLFLDEIAEIPVKLQAKLLEVLEERRFIKVGGRESKTIDIRILAATNRDLKTLVEKGQFREDLYYRLNVIEITIPPLREREDDILPFVSFYINKFNKKYGRQISFSKEALGVMQAYPWPGNVRELSHIIERLAVIVQDDVIQPHHLTYLADSGVGKAISRNVGGVLGSKIKPLDDALKDVEKNIIISAHSRLKSSYKVAEALEISQSKAYRLIRKHCGDGAN